MNSNQRSRDFSLASWLVAACLFPALGMAQGPQATHISPWLGETRGVVIDESGQPIEGVLVRVVGNRALETTTDQHGRFHFDKSLNTLRRELEFLCPGYVFYRARVLSYEAVSYTHLTLPTKA